MELNEETIKHNEDLASKIVLIGYTTSESSAQRIIIEEQHKTYRLTVVHIMTLDAKHEEGYILNVFGIKDDANYVVRFKKTIKEIFEIMEVWRV